MIRTVMRVVSMGLEAVWAFKLRSVFVVLGVAFGIASLTLIVTAVDGANRKAVEMVEMFGPDAALVFGGNFQKRAVGMRTLTLSREDAARIRDSLPGAYQVLPMRSKGGQTVKAGSRNYQDVQIVGTTENYAQAWNWPLAEGRDITAEDERIGAKVAILGETPARELFGDLSPVGKVVYISDIPFQVVGKLAYRGVTSGRGGDVDNRIIIPLSTLVQRYNMDRQYFRALRVKFVEAEHMGAYTENLRSLLRHLHHLAPEEDDDFTILTADEVLKFLSMFKGGLTLFLGVTAGIAVLVGGFVLANLFSISVSERAEEIGLKKAMGARNSAIMLQFLVEACALTLLGGVLGLFLGLGLGQFLSRLDILTIQFSWKAFLMALAGSQAVGLIFGLKPARQAASLDPIQALRGEG
ncbi:ABC transporter permease [Pseudodesulfovibrio indicus]|uniref:ABC transport system permease protein n=1 Tax=Pseudodesulfovibrio indicus TaxID=1716143 RepID=A0A126QL06_9BACT|nr:ABC transporter permease [Pseudodesulfovibrio indicus]AMK10456.1 multidrug ABC transporter substrate-binding protein [Pseudodesulfovibrio indicus]TDT89148.1 putative ABC transport system permease protein [Pseudodesulfovibrio indicus]